jgi:hypothetical protein
LSVRRILVGIACGAGVGILLRYAAFGGPQGAVEEANEFVTVVGLASIVAILGGITGGVLRASGWAMFAGAIVGAIVLGLLGVVATLHLKGLIYSIIGGPLGALVVFLFGVGREAAKPVVQTRVPITSAGIWDNELHR